MAQVLAIAAASICWGAGARDNCSSSDGGMSCTSLRSSSSSRSSRFGRGREPFSNEKRGAKSCTLVRRVDGNGVFAGAEIVGDRIQEALQSLSQMQQLQDSNVALSEPLLEFEPVADVYGAVASLPSEQRTGLLIVTAIGFLYLTARPGVLLGAIDAYFFAPLQFLWDSLQGRRNWKSSNFLLENRVGEGSFGAVYAGVILPPNVEQQQPPKVGRRARKVEEIEGSSKFQKVILKKVKIGVEGAEECGDMEDWFNYRLRRAAPDVCAEYLGSFVADSTYGQFVEGGRWLIFKYEGELTLADYMRQSSFPENLGEVLADRRIQNETDQVRLKALLIKKVTYQIIKSLKRIHDTGIVHRDVKPANLMIASSGKVKLIDFGAAADLRVGKNYVPDQGMLDPDYCPPELYVLPEKTPKPPPEPIAAALSPFIWLLNKPDLFDMYSVGIILLQMTSPNLRTAIGLKTFKEEIEKYGYDLKKWREGSRMRINIEVLDLDGGKGWDLATKLIRPREERRLSAAAALRHPFLR